MFADRVTIMPLRHIGIALTYSRVVETLRDFPPYHVVVRAFLCNEVELLL